MNLGISNRSIVLAICLLSSVLHPPKSAASCELEGPGLGASVVPKQRVQTGWDAFAVGRYEASERAFLEALELARENRHETLIAEARVGLSKAQLKLGNPDAAKASIETVFGSKRKYEYDSSGHDPLFIQDFRDLADLYSRGGEPGEAVRVRRMAIQQAEGRTPNNSEALGMLHAYLARDYATHGCFREAEVYFLQAHDLFRESGSMLYEDDAMRNLAQLYEREGRIGEAIQIQSNRSDDLSSWIVAEGLAELRIELQRRKEGANLEVKRLKQMSSVD